MKSLSIHIIVLSLLLFGSQAQVHASQGRTLLASYPATEDSIAPGVMAPTPVEVTSSVQIKTQLQAPAPAPKAPPVQNAAPVASAASFDAVPFSQIEPVIQRLKVIEELIRTQGRAYDYRALTLKQLKGILSQLQSAGAKPQSAPAAPIPTAPLAPAAKPAISASERNLKSLPIPVELEHSNDSAEI